MEKGLTELVRCDTLNIKTELLKNLRVMFNEERRLKGDLDRNQRCCGRNYFQRIETIFLLSAAQLDLQVVYWVWTADVRLGKYSG